MAKSPFSGSPTIPIFHGGPVPRSDVLFDRYDSGPSPRFAPHRGLRKLPRVMTAGQEQLPHRRIAPAAALMLCLTCALLCMDCFAEVGTHPAPPAAASIRVGSLQLRRCSDAPAYCG